MWWKWSNRDSIIIEGKESDKRLKRSIITRGIRQNNSRICGSGSTIKGQHHWAIELAVVELEISELRFLPRLHSFHLLERAKLVQVQLELNRSRSCNHWKPLANYYWSKSHSIITVPHLDRPSLLQQPLLSHTWSSTMRNRQTWIYRLGRPLTLYSTSPIKSCKCVSISNWSNKLIR